MEIKKAAGIDIDVFINSDGYPDEITYRLAAAASEYLGKPLPLLLEEFGTHWVVKTAKTGYPDLMAAGGRTLGEFLMNLPTFHQRVSLLFPHLDPPEFACTDLEERGLRLHYYSPRMGLTPFVVGLLKGLGTMFSTNLRVEVAACKSEGADHDEFLVRW